VDTGYEYNENCGPGDLKLVLLFTQKFEVMNECYGKKFILNGELQPAEAFDNSMVYEGNSIYEVIRLFKGSPVFFQDHMDRLAASAKLQGKQALADASSLRKSIIGLTRSDRKKEANIKIIFNFNNELSNYLIYFIEPGYPTEEQYKKGVKGILYKAERKDPESKVINHKLRSSIYYKLIHEEGYEALLVNENNFITEGSRSNIFFLKGETLTTAPDEVILNGITRKHILEICRDNNINVELACVNADNISEYESVFMTGTSPMVLPFYCIDNKFFNVRIPLIKRLRELYILKAEESILHFRSE
jgi:branched-chain amino acid aminotransferase